MNIRWFDSGKIMQGMALIGKNGQIRFKAAFAESMNFKQGERWKIGVNQEHTILYFIKPDKGFEHNGFKMMYQNYIYHFIYNSLRITIYYKLPYNSCLYLTLKINCSSSTSNLPLIGCMSSAAIK